MASAYLAGTLSASIKTARSRVLSGIRPPFQPPCPIPGPGERRLCHAPAHAAPKILRIFGSEYSQNILPHSGRVADLVLRPGVEIRRIMALSQLFMLRARGAVDHAPALHRRAGVDHFRPGHDMLILVHAQK